MKKIFIYSLMVAAIALVSCNKEGLDPLTQAFPPAEELVLTSLSSSATAKTETTREFLLSFSGENGASIETVLLLARVEYALKAGAYVPGETSGSYVASRTKVNGKSVSDKAGVITVRNTEGSSVYTLEFALFDSEAKPYRASWKGELLYAPDPEPVALTEVLVAQANDNGTVTVKLGSAGMTVDAMGTPAGDGFALTADIYSPDGALHEGVYTAATGAATGEGEFAPGYEYDLSAWGMGIMHWGTCWWAGSEVTHITSGTIIVEKKGNKFVITWGDESTYPHWAVFTGAIEELEPSAAPDPDYSYTETLGGAVDNTFTPVEGVETHSLVFINAEGQEVAWFDLVLTSGVTDLSGEYVCTEYAHEDHTFGNGYDLSMWGMGMGGSRYLDGSGNMVLINPGETLSVAKLAEGIYEFSGEGYDFIIGSGGGSGFDGVVLTQFCSSSDYTGYGNNLAGVELATEGVTVTPGAWGNTYGGDGNYIKLEFYSTDGKLAPGTYTPCAEGGNVGEGEFGIGYDGAWGASGTTWYTLAGGETSYVYVTDGSLEVSLEGDEYTIVLTSSTVNAKYVGKLTAE